MAFPFAFGSSLRQQLLLAIGATTLASIGCTTQHRANGVGAAGRDVSPLAGTGGKVASAAGTPGSMSPAGTGGIGAGGMTARAGAGAQAGMGTAAAMCGSFLKQMECLSRETMVTKAKYGCGMIPDRPPIRTDAEVEAQFLPNGCIQYQAACNGCCNPAVEPGVPQGDGSCCYTFCAGSCCGRPLIVDGAMRLAGVERRGDWFQPLGAADSAELSGRIAAEWLEDARMEHASIASFARFTLDLLAFGAPAELVAAAQRAGLEEVGHARLCFGLAARYGAGELGPAPLAAAGIGVASSLWDAAVAAFDEGCVGETLAALQAREASERALDLEVRGVLEQIAGEEASHAALAWRFVAWSVGRLGGDFVRELERRVAQLTAAGDVAAEREAEGLVAALHAAGRLTPNDKARIAVAGVREVVVPCVRALAGKDRRNQAVGVGMMA